MVLGGRVWPQVGGTLAWCAGASGGRASTDVGDEAVVARGDAAEPFLEGGVGIEEVVELFILVLPDARVDLACGHSGAVEADAEVIGGDGVDRGGDGAGFGGRKGAGRAVAEVFAEFMSADDNEVEGRVALPGFSREKDVDGVPGLVDVEVLKGATGLSPRPR